MSIFQNDFADMAHGQISPDSEEECVVTDVSTHPVEQAMAMAGASHRFLGLCDYHLYTIHLINVNYQHSYICAYV